MRSRRWVAWLVVLLLPAGCGGEEPPGSAAARHLDPRADLVASISLDYEGEDWSAVKRLYAKAVGDGRLREQLDLGGPVPPTLDGALNFLAGFSGISFRDDIRPLLGGRLLVAARASRDEQADPETVLAYKVPDPDALERLVEKLRGQGVRPGPLAGVEGATRLADWVAIVGGDTLVAVVEPGSRGQEAVLRERAGATGAGPPLPAGDDALVAVRLAPAWIGNFLTAAETQRALTRSSAGRALRGAELRLDADGEELAAAGRVDFEGLDEEQLPVGPRAALELPSGEAIASASNRQDRTTVFLTRLARELLGDSRFVRRAEALERREGLRFEDEVLRAFSGPSSTVLRPGTRGDTLFAARSELRDPDRMRRLLPRIAPALPGILEALDRLGRPGLTALLLTAPDAPLTPAAAGLLAQVDVRRIVEQAGAQLYEVSGLDPRNRTGLTDALVYGVVGDVFVVGSTRELAEQAAAMPTEQAEPAGTRLRLDLERLPAELPAAWDPFLVGLARALFSRIELEASAEDGDVVVAANTLAAP